MSSNDTKRNQSNENIQDNSSEPEKLDTRDPRSLRLFLSVEETSKPEHSTRPANCICPTNVGRPGLGPYPPLHEIETKWVLSGLAIRETFGNFEDGSWIFFNHEQGNLHVISLPTKISATAVEFPILFTTEIELNEGWKCPCYDDFHGTGTSER